MFDNVAGIWVPQYHENDHDVVLYLFARRKQTIINPSQDYSWKLGVSWSSKPSFITDKPQTAARDAYARESSPAFPAISPSVCDHCLQVFQVAIVDLWVAGCCALVGA